LINKDELITRRHLGFLLIALGMLLVIASLVTDALGIGNGAGIGWKQILEAVIGVLIAVGGEWWGCKTRKKQIKHKGYERKE